jgi:hypothetical protein
MCAAIVVYKMLLLIHSKLATLQLKTSFLYVIERDSLTKQESNLEVKLQQWTNITDKT